MTEPITVAGLPRGLALLAVRRVTEPAVVARFPLAPGDEVLVREREVVETGTALARRLRDPVLREVNRPSHGSDEADDPQPGRRWTAGEPRRGEPARVGEYLFEVAGRWHVVSGELSDPIEAPLPGTVDEIRPAMSMTIRTAARGLRASFVLGGPVRGRLAMAASAGGELRSSAIDVGRAGEILVAGARIDAEALTRARAMGVRGVVVGGMPSKERRDFIASEARQRAARQGLPPFAVLVLGGPLRRPIAGPLMAVLRTLEGRDVAILADPPVLAFDDAAVEVAPPPVNLVRVRSGPLLGVEGRWAGLAGLRQFPGGVQLEAGFVAIDDGPPVAVPLGDLERFG